MPERGDQFAARHVLSQHSSCLVAVENPLTFIDAIDSALTASIMPPVVAIIPVNPPPA